MSKSFQMYFRVTKFVVIFLILSIFLNVQSGQIIETAFLNFQAHKPVFLGPMLVMNVYFHACFFFKEKGRVTNGFTHFRRNFRKNSTKIEFQPSTDLEYSIIVRTSI